MPEFFSGFNFVVVLSPSGRGGDEALTRSASFSEVTGLEVSVSTEPLAEGGYNVGMRQLVKGPQSGTLVFKRGIATDNGFWIWVHRCLAGPFPLPYIAGEVRLHPPSGDRTVSARWVFVNGIANKVSGPSLAAAGGGTMAMEELHIAHEGLRRLA